MGSDEAEFFELVTGFLVLCVPALLLVGWRLRVRLRERAEQNEMRRRNRVFSDWLENGPQEQRRDEGPNGKS